jgi:hypothetical protein
VKPKRKFANPAKETQTAHTGKQTIHPFRRRLKTGLLGGTNQTGVYKVKCPKIDGQTPIGVCEDPELATGPANEGEREVLVGVNQPPLGLRFRFPVERHLKLPKFFRCSYPLFAAITISFASLCRLNTSTAVSLLVGYSVPQINATISSSDFCYGPGSLVCCQTCGSG